MTQQWSFSDTSKGAWTIEMIAACSCKEKKYVNDSAVNTHPYLQFLLTILFQTIYISA